MITKGKYSFDEWVESGYNADYDMYQVIHTDVYLNSNEIGVIDFISEDEIVDMSDEEVEELVTVYLNKSYIDFDDED